MSSDSARLEFLGELAGGLAHEIKNPLSTMRLHLELMQEDFVEHEEGEFKRRNGRKVDLLISEVLRLEGIVQEFLKISRGHDMKLTATDFAQTLRGIVELLRPEAEAENVSLHLQTHSSLGTVLVDEKYLHAALINLVQNAIQACIPKGGGKVIIEAGRKQSVLGISIIDTGIGIPASQKDRIFRAYFTTRAGGTGMGLSLARRVIEEHHGYLTFDSIEGHGSRFMIMLPLGADAHLSQIARVEKGFDAGSSKQVNVEAVVNEVLASSRNADNDAEAKTGEATG